MKQYLLRISIFVLMIGMLLHEVKSHEVSNLKETRLNNSSQKVLQIDRLVNVALSNATATKPVQIQQESLAKTLRNKLPEVQIRWNPLTGGAGHIFSYDSFLSGPQEEKNPEDIAYNFILENENLFNLTRNASFINSLNLVKEFKTIHNGINHLIFLQSYKDLSVLGGNLKFNILSNGSLLSVSSNVYPIEILSTAFDSTENFSEEAALKSAFEELGLISITQLRAPIKSKKVLCPVDKDIVKRAWEFQIKPQKTSDSWKIVVETEQGKILKKVNLTWSLQEPAPPRAKIFALNPQPNLPKSSVQPPLMVNREIRSMAGNPIASPKGWIDLAQQTTIGNNVRAQEDMNADNQGGFRPRSEKLDFDFPLVLGKENEEPENFQAAAITNLFYWTNFMHDYLYELGFNEAAGNFQLDNFGRGGNQNDPVVADALDGEEVNNATFESSEDGSSPRLSMYVWKTGTPTIDGDYDAEVILHEYIHGLTTRLVGDPTEAGLSLGQGAGMGEGWSDWFALSILTNDSPSLLYTFGSYVTQNFTRGIRRFPYSTNLEINPLTYKDIDPTQAQFSNPTEVHRIGEIWCLALWEVRANFISKYGFQDGKKQIEQLVVDALKLSPTNPSMLDGRDALLLADVANNQGKNFPLIWQGFAKRGMGFSAQAFGGGLTPYVAQSFELPPYLSENGKIILNSKIFTDGENINIQLGQVSLTSLEKVTVSVKSTLGDTQNVLLSKDKNSSGLFSGNLSVQIASTSTVDDGKLQAQVGDEIFITLIEPISTPNLTATARVGKKIQVFQDSLEKTPKSWISKKGWALTKQFAHSPKNSYTDSPNKNYPPSANLILIAPTFNISKTQSNKLTFWHKFDFEKGFDFGLVEVKSEKQKLWKPIAAFSGTQDSFSPTILDLSNLDGSKNLQVRFRLISDKLKNEDGWYIDDVEVTGAKF